MAVSADPPPLSSAAFHILLALAGGVKHGYAIMKEAAAASAGAVQLQPGTLYTTIRRLLEESLIAEAEAPPGADSTDERRRYYAITAAGLHAATAELARLEALARHAAAALRTKASE